MNLYHMPTFDESLADSVKLAEVRRVTEQAMEFAEKQLGKISEPDECQDVATVYAMNCGLLEATVEVLCAYLGQIAGTCKPDPVPGLDDLDEWYDRDGTPNPKGAYDAHGHHFAERDGRISCDY